MVVEIENKCPHCGIITNRASSISKEDATPKESSFSVCVECGGISVYTAGLYQRKAFVEDLLKLYHEQKETFKKIVIASGWFQKLRQQKQEKEN